MQGRKSAGLLFGVCVAVMMGSVASCTGGRQPTASTSSTASVSTAVSTPSPTRSLRPAVPFPDKPAGWDDPGEDGARAAAVWFIAALWPYTRENLDTAPWLALSDPACKFCTAMTEGATGGIANGEFLRESGVTATVLASRENTPLSYTVILDAVEAPFEVWSTDGTFLREESDAHLRIGLVMHREGDEWWIGAGERFSLDETIPGFEDLP